MAAPALRVAEGRLRAYRHTWRGSVFTTFLSPLLYLLAMGMGLGTLVDRDTSGTLAGVGYLQFLAPGLLAATAMQTAAGDSSWSLMAGFKWRKTFHSALATPLRPVDLVAGHLLWVAARVAMSVLAFGLVAVVLGAMAPLRGLLALAPALLTGMAFAAAITAFTASLERETGLAALFRFGIVPMFLFSGTFFPVTQLPAAIQPLAYAVPLWHGVQLSRAAALGLAPAVPALVSVAYLLAWTSVGSALAARAFHRRLVT